MPDWKKNAYGYPVFRAGNEGTPIDPMARPRVGDRVRLEFEDNDFSVHVEGVADTHYVGRVISIGPEPTLQSHGVKRGDRVEFVLENVMHLNQTSMEG